MGAVPDRNWESYSLAEADDMGAFMEDALSEEDAVESSQGLDGFVAHAALAASAKE